ncbi:GNAT family N-acetyltransferase [Vibrio quintilis]|uniref:tRNA(Met) cytidine acetyltransferase TmcA n=1 Tax=Vibrio quintilis TaxID=1117707 RepID=A0A1M7YPL5_9VIBR|nr:GNAT family N-acetyltransferase [Vibrio quintilis]SHO54549.1 tRNA(Met) cytidine acetyltransferase TmcA [Vibrio quintilis]
MRIVTVHHGELLLHPILSTNHMSEFSQYISELNTLLLNTKQRAGLVLRGQPGWIDTRLQDIILCYSGKRCLQLGGTARNDIDQIDIVKGRHFLGQECYLLIVDLSEGVDADNLNALLGTLAGGGILVFIHPLTHQTQDLASQWLSRALDELFVIIQNEALPNLPDLPKQEEKDVYQQQKDMIKQIIHVSEGHSKRPLVITADRGRGKSSALGIAAAELMQRRMKIKIVITAPSPQAVKVIFNHAQRLLDTGSYGQLTKKVCREQAELIYIPPDELLRTAPQIDLLLVDEASAIPVPVLQQLTRTYNRIVFSTTIHGYEGCGRGFTLKFLNWLKDFRPQFRHCHLSQPIRWADGDRLEKWQFRTFLLDADLPEITSEIDIEEIQYRYVKKEVLFSSVAFFAKIFALLTQAHYQTSPNDMMRILSDDRISLFIAEVDGICLGCVLTVNEGELTSSAVENIRQGIHRPKGHLVPVTLMNQLGLVESGKETCCRIMRIVIHPQLQRQGLGRRILNHCISQSDSDYVATSFGASDELLRFWIQQKFIPVKLGSRRDQSSGCYSVLMIQQCPKNWFPMARTQFSYYFLHTLHSEFCQLEPSVVRLLLSVSVAIPMDGVPFSLLENYARGGANYESVAVWIRALIGAYPYLSSSLVSDLMIMKILQNRSWSDVAAVTCLPGRKTIESYLREHTKRLILNLQCK